VLIEIFESRLIFDERCNNEATRSRLNEIESKNAAESLRKECEQLRQQLQSKEELISTLERDLLFGSPSLPFISSFITVIHYSAHQTLHNGRKTAPSELHSAANQITNKKCNEDYYSTARRAKQEGGLPSQQDEILSLSPTAKQAEHQRQMLFLEEQQVLSSNLAIT
jgi:hypothetical protein